MVPIQEFADVVTGGTPSTSVREYWEGGSIPWLNSGELNKGSIFDADNFITEAGLANSAAHVMPENTVLIALTGATTGISALLRIKASANQSVTGILPSPKHVPSYLLHYLRSIRNRIVSDSWGGAQKHISQGYVKQLGVPLPPIFEQRRIAEILDKADALRAKRRAALAKLDALTQSIFLDMFGDPVLNPRGWPTNKLVALGSLDRGVSKHRPRNAPELLGGPYPFVQTGDVANCNGYIRTFTNTYSEVGRRQSKMWPAGTLCITIAANIAKTGILTFDACFPDSIVGFRAEDAATVEFVRGWLAFLQGSLEEKAPESAQKNINLEILRGLDVPTPRGELQREFARRIAAVETLKVKHRGSLDELDALFASLQHRAFRGEL